MQVSAFDSGYISRIEADVIGHASVLLGAGRLTKTDEIDPGAGICFYRKVGDMVSRGDVLCSLWRGEEHRIDDEKLFDIMEMVSDAITISEEKPKPHKAIIDVIE